MLNPYSLLNTLEQEELKRLAELSPKPGCFVEVGVYRGGSAQILLEISNKRKTTLYLYDTFNGIPIKDSVDFHNIGDFSDTSIDLVRSRVPGAVFCKGLFPETLIEMQPVSFVHCDVDQYQSTKDVILHLYPKLLQGGMILVDDYPYLAGAVSAVHEMCELYSIPLEYSKTGKALLIK